MLQNGSNAALGGSLIPPMRVDATIGVAYYPVMASMPQWELPHTKVEQDSVLISKQKERKIEHFNSLGIP